MKILYRFIKELLIISVGVIVALLFMDNLKKQEIKQQELFSSNIDTLLMIDEIEIAIPLLAQKKKVEDEDKEKVIELLTKLYNSSLEGIPQNSAKEWVEFKLFITRPEPLGLYIARVYITYDADICSISVTSEEISFRSRVIVDLNEIKDIVDYLTTKYRSEF